MTALRTKHRDRACFYGRREIVVRLRIDGIDELLDSLAASSRSIERAFRPGRYLQRFADNMAGNGRKWKNR